MVGVSRGNFQGSGPHDASEVTSVGALFLMLGMDILALGSSSQGNPEALVAPFGQQPFIQLVPSY